MNISGIYKCYFIVYTSKTIIIEEIEKDKKLWDEIMLPKLSKFYFKYYLPELA